MPARLAVVALITGVFGMLMGMPFPTAIAALARKPQLISLGWTVNGGTTVVQAVAEGARAAREIDAYLTSRPCR